MSNDNALTVEYIITNEGAGARVHGVRQNAVMQGRRFTSRFIEPGIVSYEDCGGGMELLRKETIDAALASMIGVPLIINHQNVTPANRAQIEKGIIEGVSYNAQDNWFYCVGTVSSEDAQGMISGGGFSVSCSYDITNFGPGGTYHNIKYKREIAGVRFTHLAIVSAPRYEGATIRLNSKQQTKNKEMTVFKWIKKKLGGEDAGTPGEVNASTLFVIGGDKVALGDMVDRHNSVLAEAEEEKAKKDNEAKPEEINGDTVIDCGNGVSATLNELREGWEKWKGIGTEMAVAAGTTTANNSADEGKAEAKEEAKEKAEEKKEAAEDKKDNEAARKNSTAPEAPAAPAPKTAAKPARSISYFNALQEARNNGGTDTNALGPIPNASDGLELGKQRYGSGGK